MEGRAFFLNPQRIGTALKMLIEAEENLRSQGITLWLSSLNPRVLKTVQQSPLGETLGRARMFFNLQGAVAHYERLQSRVKHAS